MKKIVYQLTPDGFILERHVADINTDGVIIDDDKINFITIDPPNTIYKPRYVGTQWVEGETEAEKSVRESNQLIESLKPSPTEISDAELEIKLITTLTELGVIR